MAVLRTYFLEKSACRTFGRQVIGKNKENNGQSYLCLFTKLTNTKDSETDEMVCHLPNLFRFSASK